MTSDEFRDVVHGFVGGRCDYEVTTMLSKFLSEPMFVISLHVDGDIFQIAEPVFSARGKLKHIQGAIDRHLEGVAA